MTLAASWSWLGRQPFEPTAALQEHLRQEILEGRGRETLLLCEHDPVITLGRRARPDHLLLSPSDLAARGIQVTRASRGGEVTYHGPGQLVCYPIVRLRRGVLAHVEGMAQAVIALLADLEIAGEWRRTFPGVWVGPSKICAFGVQVRQGVAVHGLALNVATDLGAFATIVPCGLPGVGVTSVAQLRRGTTPSLPNLAGQLARFLARAFGLDLDPLPIPPHHPESFGGFQLQNGKPDR